MKITISIYSAILLLLALVCSSCQESLEDKAERQAKDYTRKYCPTPLQNHTRTDSIVFNKQRRVYTYHLSLYDELDSQEVIDKHRSEIVSMLQQSLRESTGLKGFVEAGFRFEYVCRSGSDSKKILLKVGL